MIMIRVGCNSRETKMSDHGESYTTAEMLFYSEFR